MLVDQGDPAARVAQRLRCSNAAKAAANDDNARHALVRDHAHASQTGEATPQRPDDEAVNRQRTWPAESNEAKHHQIIGEIDRLLVSRVHQRAQSDQYDSRDPRTRPQDQKDQTSQLDQDGQACGQLRGQQLLCGLGMKERLRHVEVADLHDTRPEEQGGDPATQE